MIDSVITCMDFIGTVVFALSGVMVGVKNNMDIFGVNMLALATAVGGGIIRDLLIGHTPPRCLDDPTYFVIAMITASLAFVLLYRYQQLFRWTSKQGYQKAIFWCDTMGLAAFTVDGVRIGMLMSPEHNIFLPVCLGVLTGAGGGVIRDVLSHRMPEIFVGEIYAMASITGGLVLVTLVYTMPQIRWEPVGFGIVVLIRYLAWRYHLNLPVIREHS